MAATKPTVRKAQMNDFDRVYPLLQKMEHSHSSREDWHKLFENHWQLEDFSPGLLLVQDDKVVGFLSTIYSIQTINNKPQIFCNLSSWIVEEEYRSFSFLMILPLVRNKDIVLTSYSSNDVSYAVYNKLGFKEVQKGTRIVYPFPSLKLLLSPKKYEIICDTKIISEKIDELDKQIFNDHRSFQADMLLVRHGNESCFITGKKNYNRFEIYAITNKAFFQTHLKHFRFKLMLKLKVNVLWIKEYLLDNQVLLLSRKVDWGLPYQYKTNNESVIDPVPFYSEFFLLKM